MKIQRRCRRCGKNLLHWLVERWSDGRITVQCADCSFKWKSKLRSTDGPRSEYPVTHRSMRNLLSKL